MRPSLLGSRLGWLLALVAGCALVSKSPPLDVRYFSPEPSGAAGPDETERAALPDASRPRVRLGRVTAGSYLGDRIVYRASSVEVALYPARLWTERPENYVRRALERALFAQQGLDQAVGGSAPVLDVEILAFEEIRTPRHAGRVQLRYRLRDEGMVLTAGTTTAVRDARGAEIAAVVDAIGAAMRDASTRIADIVAQKLTAR